MPPFVVLFADHPLAMETGGLQRDPEVFAITGHDPGIDVESGQLLPLLGFEELSDPGAFL